MNIKRIFIILGKIIIAGLTVYSLVLIAGFLLVKYNITNTAGQIDQKNNDFQANEEFINSITATQALSSFITSNALPKAEDSQAIINRKKDFCRIRAIKDYSPKNAQKILQIVKEYNNEMLINKMIFAVSLKLDKNTFYKEKIALCDKAYKNENINPDEALSKLNNATSSSLFIWQNYEEWSNMREALIKDKEVIYLAASSTNIEPRLLVSIAIVEQLRMYYTQRALYKQFFAPLKILGNATKFSLGIMNIKEKTAIETEEHLKDRASNYYLGPAFENFLDFKATSTTDERYKRLTDEKNHYYSYLYGALYIKQIMIQWQRAGFDISERPEIISTLFNVGFKNSHPKAKPEVGGAEIEIGGIKYSFGSLSYEFYYSGEMENIFPYNKN